MNADSLSKLLQVLNDAPDVPDEDKTAAATALAKDFTDSVDVSDDDAVDAMPDGMRSEYDAETDENKKAAFRGNMKDILRKQEVKRLAAARPANKTTASDDAPLTAKNFGALLAKHMPPQGRVTAGLPANAQNSNGQKTGAVGFSARIKAQMEVPGVSKGKAILLARAADHKGFAEWEAAGRPE